MKEFETKVLDINPAEIEKKLLELGAKKEPEVLMRRWVYDFKPEKQEWLRLRDDGHKTTLTYKQRSGPGISETEEIEVRVSNFEKAAEIFSKLKIEKNFYQENKRILFKLKGVEFCLDTWPMIPTHLEIESSSEKKVKEGLAWLGLENKAVGNISVREVYAKHGIDLHAFKELKF